MQNKGGYHEQAIRNGRSSYGTFFGFVVLVLVGSKPDTMSGAPNAMTEYLVLTTLVTQWRVLMRSGTADSTR
jgi:hypothetical protein